MANIDNMYRLQHQYKILYDDISSSLNILRDILSSSEDLVKIDNYVTIDDMPVNSLNMKSNRDKLVTYYNELQNHVLPRLLDDIKNVDVEIEVAEAMESATVLMNNQKIEENKPSRMTYISSGN